MGALLKGSLAALFACMLATSSGCAMHDLIWSAFGKAYTEGGATSDDRYRHFSRSVERSASPVQHYDPTYDR